MAASDRNTRRADEAERIRHIAASEAAAFATTAGTMLLGLVIGAEAAQNRNEPQPPAAPTPPPPSSHPNEVAPIESTPADHPPTQQDGHADVIEAPAADPMPMIHADAAATVEAPHPAALVDAPPGGQANTTHALVSSIPVWTFDAPTHHTPWPGESTGIGGTATQPSIDPGGSVHQPSDTITGLVDTSLATVTQTIAALGTAVGQLTSSLTTTVSDLVGGLTGLVTNLTHHAPATGAAEPPVVDILGPTPAAATDSSDTPHQGSSLLDTAGAVPMALLQPLELRLGFLGQPTTDGHETHDGAFSALGVHFQ